MQTSLIHNLYKFHARTLHIYDSVSSLPLADVITFSTYWTYMSNVMHDLSYLNVHGVNDIK